MYDLLYAQSMNVWSHEITVWVLSPPSVLNCIEKFSMKISKFQSYLADVIQYESRFDLGLLSNVKCAAGWDRDYPFAVYAFFRSCLRLFVI